MVSLTAVQSTLASNALAEDMGIDLSQSAMRLKLGIGGRSAEAAFVNVEIRLYKHHNENDFVSWFTDVGSSRPGTPSSS